MYDPLNDTELPNAAPRVGYWAGHSVEWPACLKQLPRTTDALVIGGGYTGLNAAIELRAQGREVTVIDAEQLAWGCSSRNAGFVMKSTGRLGLKHWHDSLGEDVGYAMANEHQLALEQIKAHVQHCPDHCDLREGGYVKLAHNKGAVKALRSQYQFLRSIQQPVTWLNKQQVADTIKTQHGFAGLKFDDCFAINPVKLAASVARQAHQAGVQLVEHCAATAMDRLDEGWRVHTAQGEIVARDVLFATNAYTTQKLFPGLTRRNLPVVSSVIVTPPLSRAQLDATGLKDDYAYMDTRVLKYYFRLLPDGRLLFGGRGAIRGANAENPRYARRLLAALHASFPALKDITHWDDFWSGWISVSLDDYPRVMQLDNNVYASMGYCGAGVSFSALAGKRLAEKACGLSLPTLPYYQSNLKPFPFAGFRRIGQWAFYHYGRLRDMWG